MWPLGQPQKKTCPALAADRPASNGRGVAKKVGAGANAGKVAGNWVQIIYL